MSLSLPTSPGPNLAPAEPLLQNMQQKAADRSQEIDAQWFDDERKRLEREELQSWEAEFLKDALIYLVIEGKTLLRKARHGKGWRYPALPERTDLPVYGFNFTGFYSEALKAAWTSSNTDINWRPARDLDDVQGAARAAQHVREHLKRQLETNEFKQTEALLAQCGKYVRYSYYTDKRKSYARRPKIEKQQLQLGESTYLCPDCGAGGTYNPDGRLQANNGNFGPAVFGNENPQFGQPYGDVRPGFTESMAAQSGQPLPLYGQPGIEGLEQQGVDDGQTGAMGRPGAIRPSDSGLEQNPEMLDLYQGSEEAIGGISPVSGASSPFGDSAGTGGACPACGSLNIAIEQAEPFEVERINGYEEFEVGSIVRECVPVFELKHDTTKSPQDSDYLIRSRRIRLASIQYEYPDLQISKSNGDDLGLKMEEALKRSTMDGAGRSTEPGETPTVDFIQIWLTPCMYGNNRLKEPMVTRSGETIPAGTLLGDRFKKGLYMCFIQGVKGVIELRDECHKDFWGGAVLRQRAISSLGSGIEDIVNANMQINLVYSIIFEQLRTSAMPATLFDERLLPNGVSSYIGSLSNIPVELAAVEGADIRKAVFQLQPQPPTSQHFVYGEKLNEHMQRASRVMNFSNAAPGVDNKTATGAEIGQATSQALLGPQLANKADLDKLTAEIELRLWKTYCQDEQYVSLSGRRGAQDGIWLSAANINTDLFAEVVPDSYLPQTNLERRERWDAFLQRVGGLPGLKMALQESPAQVEQLAEIFDVDLAGEDYTASAETCRERVDQMAQAIPMLAMMQGQMPTVQMAPDPMSGQMVAVPVDPMAEAGKFLMSILDPQPMMEELGHLAAIQWIRSWLTEDEGKKAPKELREGGVKALLYFHVDGLMAEAQFSGMLQMAGMPPQPPMPAGQESEKKSSKQGPRDAKQTMGAAGNPARAKQPAMAGAM